MSAHHAPFSLRDIESAVEQGREAERERIIALLVNAIIDSEGYCHADTVIALIKGECQKDNETVVLLTEGENE